MKDRKWKEEKCIAKEKKRSHWKKKWIYRNGKEEIEKKQTKKTEKDKDKNASE